MKIEIPFWPRFRLPMQNGVKVWTSRTKRYGKAGDVFEAFGEVYAIVVVVKKPLDFVAKNWSEEGCSSRDDFIEVWRKIHPRKGFVPDWEVWVHIFKKLGSVREIMDITNITLTSRARADMMSLPLIEPQSCSVPTVTTAYVAEGVYYEKCPKCGSYSTEPAGTKAGYPIRKCKSCKKTYAVTPFTYTEPIFDNL